MNFAIFLYLFHTFINAENIRDEADRLYLAQRNMKWFSDGEKLIRDNLNVRNINKKAKGVILFLGDGMGISTVTSARILDGQLKGMSGEENVLSWEKFPNVAFSKTYNTDAQIADSAGTASAFLTGVKTFEGAISVSDLIKRGTCTNVTENKLLSILEMAEIAGLSTGVVTTTRVTHATPASSYAHSPDRNYEDDSTIPEDCKDFKDIARQLIDFPYGDGIDVILGGGRRGFLPERRNDKRNLIDEWKSKNTTDQRFSYIQSRRELKSFNTNDADHVLGLFSSSHMDYSYERRNESSEQPSLIEMTEFAIRMLDRNPKGYFLLVEGGRIDHGHHENKPQHALYDAVEMNKAVECAVGMTSPEETLVIITADHSHVFTLGGYGARGSNIFHHSKKEDKEKRKYTKLGYYNGPGAVTEMPRKEPTGDDLKNTDYDYQSLVPMDYETHGGEDVGVYSQGPQGHLLRGVVEQNYIFHVMDFALCLSENKKDMCAEEGLISTKRRYFY